MELKLDGKVIGNIEGGKLVDDTNDVSGPKPETMRVPIVKLEQPENEPDEDQDDEDKREEPENEEDEDELGSALKDIKDPGIRRFILDSINDKAALTKKIDRLSEMVLQSRTPANLEEANELIDELADIPKDKDPFGVAVTLKKFGKFMKAMDAKVSRLDKHAGYTEAQAAVNRLKSQHSEFSDKATKRVAERLLEAELKTNRTDALEDIVETVARDVRGMRLGKSGTSYIKDKAETAEKHPKGIRRSDGVTPAITVNKPRNITEAGQAYKAWKAQNAKLNRR